MKSTDDQNDGYFEDPEMALRVFRLLAKYHASMMKKTRNRQAVIERFLDRFDERRSNLANNYGVSETANPPSNDAPETRSDQENNEVAGEEVIIKQTQAPTADDTEVPVSTGTHTSGTRSTKRSTIIQSDRVLRSGTDRSAVAKTSVTKKAAVKKAEPKKPTVKKAAPMKSESGTANKNPEIAGGMRTRAQAKKEARFLRSGRRIDIN